MGKLIKIKKRREKKYDPYKTNPLNKKLTNAVNGNELDAAIEKTEDGAIKLDSAGKPVFKDVIEWETNGPQIMAIWTAIKAVLEERVVPPNEIDAAFDLMAIIAKMYRKGNKPYVATLPINYFVGTWHVLNTTRRFHLFKDDPEMDKSIDGLTMWFAQRIDMYHYVKEKEAKEEATPRPSKLHSKIEYYSEDDSKQEGDLLHLQNRSET